MFYITSTIANPNTQTIANISQVNVRLNILNNWGRHVQLEGADKVQVRLLRNDHI